MEKHRFRRGLAGGLAALMLLQALPMAAFAAETTEENEVSVSQQAEVIPQLQNGTAVIPSGATESEVKEILCEALVANADEVDAQSLEWEYYCEGKDTSTGWTTNEAWGSVNGFTSEKKVVFVTTTYTHPALAANSDGDYQVRLAGTDTEVTLTKAAKLSSEIMLNENCTVTMPYNEDASVDYDALEERLFDVLVASTTPEDLDVDDVTIEYYATATTGSVGDFGKNWAPLEGGRVTGLTYPAISEGTWEIRISYEENETCYGTSAETQVTIAGRSQAPYTLKDTPDSVTLAVDENMETDFDALRGAIFSAVVASSDVLTADNVTVEYYAENMILGQPAGTHAWMPLEGGTKNLLTYPAISTGTQKIRISWPGDQNYAPVTIEATVTVKDREQIQFQLNDAPYQVGMVFTDGQGYDYAATAQAIYSAVVASTSPIQLTGDEVTVEYNASLTPSITKEFKPLDGSDWTGFKKFGTGDWEIRISWGGNQLYRGNSVTVDVTTTDDRLESAVALKSGVSFTYNMDPSVMEQAIFDNVIDWENSTLPAKETVSLDDFNIEYNGEVVYLGSGVDVGQTDWAPIGGKDVSLGSLELASIPQMGAGENQQIRVSYHGNADYRPSESTQGTVTVDKATVKVSVHSDNIYADEAIPEGFITTDPADDFDKYIIYAGVTSNVTTALYLDLPERYTDSVVLDMLDPIIEAATGKSFSEMLNDGVTLGELRELLSTQELLDLLDKLNIDTGTFGEILTVINNLPSIVDNVRVSFGTPNRAGLYTVAAVTDNQNYETGVGIGFLLVKMRLSGVNLTWNQEIENGKLTAEEAKTFDFGATLSYDGDATISQDSVSYLYSGFTSKWRVYSSTTTPPTEPGRYVMTVVTLGGNYQAAPITRSFQITK